MFNPTKNKFNLTRFASRLADDSWPVILVPLHQSSSTFILYIEQQSTVHLSCTLYSRVQYIYPAHCTQSTVHLSCTLCSRVQYIYPVHCTVEYSTFILYIVQQSTVHQSCTLYSSVQYIYPVHCTVAYSTFILYIVQQSTVQQSCKLSSPFPTFPQEFM